jgi:hypothetical protein
MDEKEAAIHMSVFQTMGIYHTAVDDGDFALLETVFAVDASQQPTGSPPLIGPKAICAALSKRRQERMPTDGTPVFQRHNLTTRRIDVIDSHTATAVSYFLVLTEIGLDHSGRYLDIFKRYGDRWLIQQRRNQLDWMNERSRFNVNAGPKVFNRFAP